MGVPLLALGPVIGWLASAFSSIFAGVLVWFAGTIAKRVAFFVLVAAAFSLISATFISSALSSLAGSAVSAGGAPSAFYSITSWLLDVGFVGVLLSLIIGIESAALIAKWQLRLLDLKARL